MRYRTFLRGLLTLLTMSVAALVLGHTWLQTGQGNRWLADWIEAVVSTPESRLEIGVLAGTVPFAPVATGVSLSDANGSWLTVDRAAVRLDPMALIARVARFESIEVGRLAVMRLPQVADTGTEARPAASFSWPALPVSLRIDRFGVAEVALGAPILGEPAQLSIDAAAKLGDPTDGLSLELAISRADDWKGSLNARMRYVPATARLAMTLRVDEPEGGILARLMALPGLPPLNIDFSGDGVLDDWQGELKVDGGDDLQLQAPTAITAEDTGHRVMVDAKGSLAAVASEPLRPLLDGETSLNASFLVGPGGLLRIDRLDLAGGFGTGSLSGELDRSANTVDVALSLLPAAPERFARLTHGASWSALRLSATATGPVLEPTLALSLQGNLLAHGDLALDSFVSTIEAAIDGPITDAGSRIDIAGELLIDGVVPGIDIPPGLVDPRIRIAARGSITRAGRVVIDHLAVDAPAALVSAKGTGEDWGAESASVVGTLDIPDLSRLHALTHQSLTGEGGVAFSADWNGSGADVRASAEFEQLSTNVATADILLGTSPKLRLAASFGVDGRVDVEQLILSGKEIAMTASGAFGPEAPGIDWRAQLPDLAAVDPSLEGALEAMGRLTGTPDEPAATVRFTLTEAAVAGYPVSAGQLDAVIKGLATQPAADVTLEAQIAGLPARATAELLFEGPGAIRIDPLELQLASLVAEGAATLKSTGAAVGEISASIGNLADLATFIGKPLTGAVDADLSLSESGGRQMAEVSVSAVGAGLPGSAEVARANLTLELSDPLRAPDIAAQLQADGILAGALALERATITANGSLDGLTVALEVSDELLAVSAGAELAFADGEARIAIPDLRARYADVSATLAGPARITLAADSVRIDGLALQGEGARLSIDGRFGDESDLLLTLSAIPLELARLATPELDWSGRLDGRFRLTGSRNAPRASGELTAGGVTLAALRKAGVSGLDGSATLDWNGDTLRGESAVTGDFGGPLVASLLLAAPADPQSGLPAIGEGSSLTGTLAGNVRLGVLNDLLAARGDRVDGTLAIDLTLLGHLAEPRIGGRFALTGGSYRGPLTGVSLDDILLRVNGDGERLTIAEFTAQAPNGGTLSGGGSIGIDPTAGFPTKLAVALDDALIIDHDIVIATLRGSIEASGALTRSLDVAGRLSIVEAEVQLPERLPPSIPTLEVVEINVPPDLEARRPLRPATAGGLGVPLRITLDLAIDAPGRIFVRGRGLDAEVGGEVTVRGNANTPDIGGGFQLRRGHLTALDRRFDFDEGILTLPEDGSIDPEIRFVAGTDLGDVSAQITVTGRASAPRLLMESVPELPQDEILARILFGKRSNSLTALESIQLARSALELTGIGSGSGALDAVTDGLGLDLIDIRQLGAVGSGLGLSGRITENMNIGVKQGLESGSTRSTVDVELTPNISLESEVGVNNAGRIGVGMEWEY